MDYSSCKRITPLLLIVACAGCAGGGNGKDVIGSVDTGLASVSEAAQTGRAAIATGTATAESVPTTGTALSDLLASRLGVSQEQALGGAGAIFQAAKANMEEQAFTTLSQSVPGMSQMLGAAPQASPAVSGVTGLLGKGSETLSTAASLASSFQQLNLSPDMVNQFIPVVVDYVKDTSGQAVANLLQSALTAP